MTFKENERLSSAAFIWIQKVTTKYGAMRALEKGRDTPRSEFLIRNYRGKFSIRNADRFTFRYNTQTHRPHHGVEE